LRGKNNFVGEEEADEGDDNSSSEADCWFEQFPSEEVEEYSNENKKSSPYVLVLLKEIPD